MTRSPRPGPDAGRGPDASEGTTTPRTHREALLARRADALVRLAASEETVARIVEGAVDANADDEHDPEGQTIAWDRAQASASADEARRAIADVDAALTRLEQGWDGACEDCGRPIPAERLAVRPATTRCVDCAGRTAAR
ncbi:TraR/DksA family transcriptional regulator [Agilicoccus flavus]|uniref:TraR/DksA family transcriptional regulator n=1 Tax=Agilicoccus flavus TaxID=2775968 RepID=UPI001CF68F49|nr:TraR/DksA family transcriptional regulator [Agilicoccus flavus]